MPTAFQLSAAALQQMLRQSTTIADAGLAVAFLSDEIDFLTIGSYAFPDLARTGFKFVNTSGVAYWLITARTGAVTAGPTTKAGNDGAHTNILPATAADPAAAHSTVGQVYIAAGLVPAALATDNLSTPPVVEVTLAATGSTVYKGKLLLVGILLPV